MGFLEIFNRKKAVSPEVKGNLTSIFNMNGNNSQLVNSDTAIKHTTVFACNKVLSESISSMPIHLYQKKDKRRTKLDNELSALISRQPNPIMNSTTWKELIVTDLNLNGNHYCQIVRNGYGVQGLYPLDPKKMKVKIRSNGKVVYEYASSKDNIVFNAEEVLHFKTLTLDGILGLSPIEYNALSLSLSMSTVEFGDKYYKNGANSNMVLQHPAELSDSAYDRLRSNFQKNFTGIANSHKPLLLEDGLTIERTSISNNDSQFLETRTFNKSEIASIFRVPPHLINEMSKSTFSNIEHQSLEFVKYTLMPTLVKIEEELNNKLLGNSKIKDGFYFKHNVNSLLRGDVKSRYESYQVGIQSGFISRNEAREWEDLDPIDGLDEMIIPLNMANVTKDGMENNGELTTQENENNEDN